MFSKGTIVEVYEDPLTMQHKEGNARIVSHMQELEPGINQYEVHFIGDEAGTVVLRKIVDHPKFALAILLSSFDGKKGDVIAIEFGEQGYRKTNFGRQTKQWVEERNADAGIDEPTAEAMSVCSLFGTWGNYETTLSMMKAKPIHV